MVFKYRRFFVVENRRRGNIMSIGSSQQIRSERYSCLICGASWKPKKKVGLPHRCPRCKSKMWNNSFKHHCNRCQYDWVSAFHSPDRCPGCQSRKWRQDESVDVSVQSYLPKEAKIPILLRYDAGMGCVKIAINLNHTFSTVYDVIKETYPNDNVRL